MNNYHYNADVTNLEIYNKRGISLYNKSKYSSYLYTLFYADRNVRPCTIQGYTLTTFPKVVYYTYAKPRQSSQGNRL